jgi:hypothetical protein
MPFLNCYSPVVGQCISLVQRSTRIDKWQSCMTFVWFGHVKMKVQLCHDKEQSLISFQSSINNAEAFTGKCDILHLIILIIVIFLRIFIFDVYNPYIYIYIYIWIIHTSLHTHAHTHAHACAHTTESVSYDFMELYCNSVWHCLTSRFPWYSETTCFTYF